METPARLDLRAAITRTDHTNLAAGLCLLFGLPLVSLLIERVLMPGHPGKFGTLFGMVTSPLVLLGAGMLIAVAGNRRNPAKHSALQWPEIGPPPRVIEAIERDWNDAAPGQIYRYQDYYLTPSWLIEMNRSTVRCYPLRCLAWAFLHYLSINPVNGRKAADSRTVVLHLTDGQTEVLVAEDEASAARFLTEIERRAPWAFYGRTDERLRAWKQQREQFVAEVRRRRDSATGVAQRTSL